MRERFLKPNKITTLTVIWARQPVSPQPKLGPAGPVAERARVDEFDAVERGEALRRGQQAGDRCTSSLLAVSPNEAREEATLA